jgi:hypothetical protein
LWACGAREVALPTPRGADLAQISAELDAGRPERVIVTIAESQRYEDAAGRGPRARLLDALSPARSRGARRYTRIPFLAIRLAQRADLERLLARPETGMVFRDRRLRPMLAQSLAQVDQGAASVRGALGAGQTIVIADTGVDYGRTAFGACAAPGAAGCKVTVAADLAEDDGARDDIGHGTNVAAIALGVAPAARIAAFDVFGPDGTAFESDVIAAIDWAIEHRRAHAVAAINLSLGGGASRSPCGGDPLSDAIAVARAQGILTTVAAGNDGFSSSLSSPACAPAAISVGAVYDTAIAGVSYEPCSDEDAPAGSVACFSNSASFLSMLAPGAFITAGGYTMAGTSQAAPHVAGAVAVLRSAFPQEDASAIAARLLRSRSRVRDPRNGITKPLLDLAEALGPCEIHVSAADVELPATGGSGEIAVSASGCAYDATASAEWLAISRHEAGVRVSAARNDGSAARTTTLVIGSHRVVVSQAAMPPTLGWTPPAGSWGASIVVAGGAFVTRSESVPVEVRPATHGSITQVCLGVDATCSRWLPFGDGVFTLALPKGDGVKHIFVWLRFVDGRETQLPRAAEIVLDTTSPLDGEGTVVRTSAASHVSWYGFGDATSGVTSYRLVYGVLPPRSCSDGALAFEGEATSVRHEGLDPALTYFYRLCAIDAAGNVSEGIYLWAPISPQGEPR